MMPYELNEWTPVAEALPPEGVEVEVISPSGHGTTLVRHGNLWFVPDGSMYVYWTPISWRRSS